MPEVPGQPYEPYGTVTPQVEQLRPIGVQFLPDAYGAATAKAMQNFGIAGVDAAQKVFERAQALKQVDIENKTRDQLTQTMGGFEDDRAKFMASEGLSATGANLTGFQAKLDAAYQDGLTKARAIGGDFAANKFGNEAASWYRQVSNAATEHSATQLKGTTKNSLRAQQALLLEELRRNPDDAPDPTTGRTIRDRLTDSEDQAGRLLGSSPEQIELDKNNILSAAAHTQIEGLKLKGDVDGATKLYEKYRDDGTLTTEAANKALKTVQAGVAGGVSLSTFGGLKTGQTMSLGTEAVAPERAKDAIARTEGTWLSSGRYNYQALGPVLQTGAHKGSQALGKYQVMEDLLPSFLRQAGMSPMTRQQYLNNPQAQEQLFENVFIKKYMTQDPKLGTDGSFNNADPKYNDGHFNTPQYVQDANRNLYRTMTEADAMRLGEQAGGRFTSIDPDAPVKVSDKVGDLFRQDVQRRRVDAVFARQGLSDFLDTEDGAQVRSL